MVYIPSRSGKREVLFYFRINLFRVYLRLALFFLSPGVQTLYGLPSSGKQEMMTLFSALVKLFRVYLLRENGIIAPTQNCEVASGRVALASTKIFRMSSCTSLLLPMMARVETL